MRQVSVLPIFLILKAPQRGPGVPASQAVDGVVKKSPPIKGGKKSLQGLPLLRNDVALSRAPALAAPVTHAWTEVQAEYANMRDD